jgi:hypothetical protein
MVPANSDLLDQLRVVLCPSILSRHRVHCVFRAPLGLFRSRAALQVEILALRRQLGVLWRSANERPRLSAADRLLWAWLSGIWADWRSALGIVTPETIIAWHRKGLRLFWAWKGQPGQPGRPPVSKETRELICKMSREDPLWGAPRIHGELLKLGIDIGDNSVSTRMVRRQAAGSQNTGRHGPAPIAPRCFGRIQFLGTTTSRRRQAVRNEPSLDAQAG